MVAKSVGWTVYIMECGDKSWHVGFCRDMSRELMKKYSLKGKWFSKHPERLPVKVVFAERGLHFMEAYAKFIYAKRMNRKLKGKLIRTGKWPYGGSLKVFLETGKIKTFLEKDDEK